MKIVWTQLAVNDLYSLQEYIAEDNPEAANQTLEKISNMTKHLSSFEKMGRTGRVRGTRELVIIGTPFLVVYRIKKNQIEILSVIHSSRRWPEGF